VISGCHNKRDDWTKNYHKMLKGLETMIDVQEQVRNIMKIAAETNMMITEMEDSILKAVIRRVCGQTLARVRVSRT